MTVKAEDCTATLPLTSPRLISVEVTNSRPLRRQVKFAEINLPSHLTFSRNPLVVDMGVPAIITLEYFPKCLEVLRGLLVLNCGTFRIATVLELHATSEDIKREKIERQPFVKRKYSRNHLPPEVSRGIPPSFPSPQGKRACRSPLASYSLPSTETLKNYFELGPNSRGTLMENYVRHSKHLLWAEEAQMMENIASFDMFDVVFQQAGHLLELRVPGLCENRPSVLRGDYVLAVRDRKTHRGFVHRVLSDSIQISFCSRKMLVGHFIGAKYDIRFNVPTTVWRRIHHALDMLSRNATALSVSRIFPPDSSAEQTPNSSAEQRGEGSYLNRDHSLDWFTKGLNLEQRNCVSSIYNRMGIVDFF